MKSYLSDDIPRPHLNPLQNTNQRLRNRRPDLQRRELITTRNQFPTRHDQHVLSSLQMLFGLLDYSLYSLCRRLRRCDKLFDLDLDNRQLPGCPETVRQNL